MTLGFMFGQLHYSLDRVPYHACPQCTPDTTVRFPDAWHTPQLHFQVFYRPPPFLNLSSRKAYAS